MTVIRPNSVSGITSITAQANEINFFRSNGALAGLQLNGVNFNTTTGVSTFNNLDVGGVLTYQDVTNVDSLGIGTFRTGINVSGGQLDVGSNIKLGNAGVITATSFVGSGANLTGIDAGVAGINTTGQSHLKLLYVNAGVVTFTNTSNPTPSATLPSGTGGHLYSFDNALNIVGGAGAGGGGLVFHEGGFTRWRISSGALHPHGTTYNNLGNSSNRVGNAYIQTSVDLVDNAEIRVGSADDLKIFHDGTDSFIHGTTGTRQLKIRGQEVRVVNEANSEIMAKFIQDGNVQLYYDNENKLSTESFGATTRHDSGTISKHRLTTNGGTARGYLYADSGNEIGFRNNSDSINFKVTSGGDAYIYARAMPVANNSQDLGSSSLRWRNIYTNDLNLSNEGSSNSVDNTWGDYTIQEGESDLFLINNRSGKKYKFNLTEVS